MPKKYLLTSDHFSNLSNLDGWKITEIDEAVWKLIPNLPRKEDTITVMASGNCDPGMLNGIQAIVGMDILVHETNPKPGEKPGNAYHMVIQELNDARFPYLMHGPFTQQTIVPHHFDAEDLNRYFEEQ